MKTIPASLLLALATAAPLVCQEDVDAPVPTTTIQSIRFAGGTLSEFAEILRRGRDTPVNIVLPVAADRVAIPAMQLTSVSIGDALQAVATILMPEMRMEVQQLKGEFDAAPVYAIAIMPMKGTPPPPPQIVRVLSLSALTTPAFSERDVTMVTPETVLTAIETGLAISDGPKVDVRFHQDSRLLFVRGQQDQVNLVEEILLRLERDRAELQGRRPPGSAGPARRDEQAEEPPPEPVPPGLPTRRR